MVVKEKTRSARLAASKPLRDVYQSRIKKKLASDSQEAPSQTAVNKATEVLQRTRENAKPVVCSPKYEENKSDKPKSTSKALREVYQSRLKNKNSTGRQVSLPLAETKKVEPRHKAPKAEPEAKISMSDSQDRGLSDNATRVIPKLSLSTSATSISTFPPFTSSKSVSIDIESQERNLTNNDFPRDILSPRHDLLDLVSFSGSLSRADPQGETAMSRTPKSLVRRSVLDIGKTVDPPESRHEEEEENLYDIEHGNKRQQEEPPEESSQAGSEHGSQIGLESLSPIMGPFVAKTKSSDNAVDNEDDPGDEVSHSLESQQSRRSRHSRQSELGRMSHEKTQPRDFLDAVLLQAKDLIHQGKKLMNAPSNDMEDVENSSDTSSPIRLHKLTDVPRGILDNIAESDTGDSEDRMLQFIPEALTQDFRNKSDRPKGREFDKREAESRLPQDYWSIQDVSTFSSDASKSSCSRLEELRNKKRQLERIAMESASQKPEILVPRSYKDRAIPEALKSHAKSSPEGFRIKDRGPQIRFILAVLFIIALLAGIGVLIAFNFFIPYSGR